MGPVAIVFGGRRVGQLGETEVEHLRVAARGDEDVRGLDVAMDDALRVCRIERVGDFDAELDDPIELERVSLDEMFERPPFEQLHHEELLPLVLADVVDRADVRVIQRRRRARLALKALRGRRVARQLGRQELDGDLPAEANILGAVDDAHAAAAKLLEDPVMRDGLAKHGMGN